MDPGIAEASDQGRAFVDYYGDSPAAESMQIICEILLRLDRTKPGEERKKPVKAGGEFLSDSDIKKDHEWCLLCGSRNPRSLKLNFKPGEGEVSTVFTPGLDLQGYSGILHGGIVSALLDSAMTHCLFNSGIKAVTGDLHVRFLHPVPCNQPLEIRASMVSKRPPLYRLKSELRQGKKIMARAEAKFMKQEIKP